MTAWLTVVGIGEDGMAGLGDAARAVLEEAGIIFGGQRHLDMLLPHLGAERRPWPSPFAAAFDQVMALRGRPVCVLASGDPMFYGMGASLARLVPAAEMRVLPSPSSFSLAAARMGWPLQETTLLTIHGRPIETLHPHVHDGARLLVLSHDGSSAAAIAALLSGRGFGPSMLDALEHLGGVAERRLTGAASEWPHGETALLNIVAVECRAGAIVQEFSTLAGLPDEAYRHDGQLTKRDVRAVVLARLAPSPGELLWDVGAGCGSIGIEWMRAHPSCHAIAVEADPGRQELIRANSLALGVPGLRLVVGQAPEALAGLESPDAIFIGGGVTDPGVFDRCWAGLRPGGRLIANAVTVQSEMMLVSLRERVGGELTRIAVAQARPLGGFDAWRSALPVTVFSACKPGHLIW